MGNIQVHGSRALGAQGNGHAGSEWSCSQSAIWAGEVRLSGPPDTVVHGAVISQMLQQHAVEPRWPDDPPDRQGAETVYQVIRALPLKKLRVIAES